jgi:hypothetical protein
MAILTQTDSKVVLRIDAGEVAKGLLLIFDEGARIPEDGPTDLSSTATGGPAVARIESLPAAGIAMNAARRNWCRPAQSEPALSDFASAMRHVEDEVYNAL